MKIAVLFGGDSMERDVSVASAVQVIAALRSRGHQVLAVDAQHGLLSEQDEHKHLTGNIARLPPRDTAESQFPTIIGNTEIGAVDLVFLALHGGNGENGTVQSVLDLAQLPYTGSGRLGSALAWDKDVAKQLFLAAGVPTAKWLMAPVDGPMVEQQLGFPVIVKPNGQGSTVGLSLVESPDGLKPAIDLAQQFDAGIMIERYIAGREFTVGILDDTALAVGEIIPEQGPIFDYMAKYQPGAAAEIFPADLNPEQTAHIQKLGLRVHRALKLQDYSRVDFRMDEQGGAWCLEVNTLPGLSSGSLMPRAAAAVGIDFAELCERICSIALARVGSGR